MRRWLLGDSERIGAGTRAESPGAAGCADSVVAMAAPPAAHAVDHLRNPDMQDGRAAGRLPAHDKQLLEQACVLWHIGDWSALAGVGCETLQHHPDRARIALMVAAAHLQLRQAAQGRRFLQLAQEYGCPKKQIAHILISGVHNTLGRAHIANGQRQRALAHFDSAIALASPAGAARTSAQARAHEQFAQLHAARTAAASGAAQPRLRLHAQPCAALPADLATAFFQQAHQARILAALEEACGDLIAGLAMPAIESTSVTYRGKDYYFVHFEDDYIPRTMRSSGLFYEVAFLNLLARLHQPHKLIVDGGANLGNHSIFFAGVMQAQVIAFEPQPHNHLLLCANRSLNGLDAKIDIRPTALGARADMATLHLAQENNYGTYSCVTPDEGRTGTVHDGIAVTVATLDSELAAHINDISILKLDIEGMELDALHGARKLLERSQPLVAVECFNKAKYAAIKDFLASFDYFVIDSMNATPTFIFLCKRNAFHMQALTSHLERVSIDKLKKNSEFNYPEPGAVR